MTQDSTGNPAPGGLEEAQRPARGQARTRILDAARALIREKGYSAMTVDDLCARAGVTKGAFFHHFRSKEDLGVAAAQDWAQMTGALFEQAPYHAPEDPLERVLAYIRFRRDLVAGPIPEFTCVVGTMAQEIHDSIPAIRDACRDSIFAHAETLEADIQAAIDKYGIRAPFDAKSLALHTQAVIQGGFILAKAGQDPALAVQSVDHLECYFKLLFVDSEGVQPAGVPA